MNRYIDAKKWLKQIECGWSFYEFLKAEIPYAPSIDIVHCSECKWEWTQKCPPHRMGLIHDADDFCSYAVRKPSQEDAQHDEAIKAIAILMKAKDTPQTEPTERSVCDLCGTKNRGIPCGTEPRVCSEAVKLAKQTEPKRGEWIHDEIGMYKVPTCRCSNCDLYVLQEANFCPNCGADMRAEQTEPKGEE